MTPCHLLGYRSKRRLRVGLAWPIAFIYNPPTSRLEVWLCTNESRLTTIAPTTAMNSSSRKPHRKSRGGCGRCKKRKIKVSEGSLLAPFAVFSFQLKCGVCRQQMLTRDLGFALPPPITFEVFQSSHMFARLTFGP